MDRKSFHSWIILSDKRIHMGTYEVGFFSHVSIFSFYGLQAKRGISLRHILAVHWSNIKYSANPYYFLYLHRNIRL